MRPHFSIRHLIALLAASAGLAACSNNDPPPPPPSDPAGQAQPGNAETQAPPDLPASFTDHVPRIRLIDSYDAATGTYEYTEQDAGAVAFEMVLIPGDPERGIEPFYMGKTEVTWVMIEWWAFWRDLEVSEAHRLIEQDLRPTDPYMNGVVGSMGLGQRPVIGMSWRTAQAYCLWLSEQTGRTYRLPTDAEWLHALALSGGVPSEPAALLAQATLAENAPFDDFFGPPIEGVDGLFSDPVASHAPNALGLYDLLGNAAEWVEPTDEGAWVRGGHFQLPADELTTDWRAVEDQEVWNATWPNQPVSRHWYLTHYYQGMRLVCEVDAQ